MKVLPSAVLFMTLQLCGNVHFVKTSDLKNYGNQASSITLQKAEMLLKQFPPLKEQMRDLKLEVEKLKDSLQNKKEFHANKASLSGCRCQCDNGSYINIQELVQAERFRSDSLSSQIENLAENLGRIQTEYLAFAVKTMHDLNESNSDVLKNQQNIAYINTSLSDIEDSTNMLLNEAEDMHRCFGVQCSTEKKSIKPPSFISQWFRMRSNDQKLSELVIEHGLNELPVKVDVQVKSISGNDNDWIFTGAAAIHSDDDTTEEHGGVVYFYNETHVILLAPSINNNHPKGTLVTTGNKNGFFVGSHALTYSQGVVRIRVWRQEDFPEPAYKSKWYPLDITDKRRAFQTFRHGLSKYPALVVLQVRAEKLISEGIGSAMTPFVPWSDAGGVLYGYDDKSVRIWTSFVPDTSGNNDFGRLFGLRDGWGLTNIFKQTLKGEFRILVWSEDNFENGNFHLRESNVQETDHVGFSVPSIDIENDLVTFSVQALDGPNEGFLFKGWGSSQATAKPFGGVIYAYNKKGILQIWRPNADNQGYLIHVRKPYGDGINAQASNSASYVVKLLQSRKWKKK